MENAHDAGGASPPPGGARRGGSEAEPGAPADDINQLALQLAGFCVTELRTSENNLVDQEKAIAALMTAGGDK